MRIWLALLLTCAVAGSAHAQLSVNVTTTPNGGQYAPRNVVAVWIEDAGGAFVKTISRYANVRKSHLVAWTQKAGANDADAISGATRLDHATPLAITWDLKDKTNALVPDGTYTIRMELADSNATQPAQNHQGTFTFVKGAAPQNQTNLANGGFQNVSIDFQPVANKCNNGVVDAGESCDPSVANSCPTACTPSADACMPVVLVGSAATCSAACTPMPITACANDDGCCAPGCDASNDNDCAGGTDELNGGCASTPSNGAPYLLLALLVFGVSRSTRRRGA